MIIQIRHPAFEKIVCSYIKFTWEPGRVGGVPARNVYDHTLSGACEQDAVGVLPIAAFLLKPYQTPFTLPSVAEVARYPTFARPDEVATPA